MPAQFNSSLKARLIDIVKRDPKKAGALIILLAVLAAMWGKMLSGGKMDPAAATAAPSQWDASSQTFDANDQYSRSPSATASLMEWLRSPLVPVDRNLFAVKFDYFPQDGTTVNQTLHSPTGDGFWDQMAKSMTAKADQKREQQILIENLQLQAAQLKLQTIMMGSRPKAMINGEMVEEGDVVGSFRILKIEARRVIVERDGIRLGILMK